MHTKFVLLLISTLFSGFAFSQLRPVKDQETCGYGLKDVFGNWVIQPYYTDIRSFGANFVVTDIDHMGVLKSDGSVLIPATYEEISPQTTYFNVRKGSLWSVFDLSGKQLFDFQYISLLHENGRFYLHKTSDNSITTTVTNLTGQILIPETEGYIMPFGSRDLTPIGETYTRNGAYGKAGLIDLTGKIVRERIYMSVEACYNNFVVSSDKGRGYISLDNKMLLEPKYFVRTPDYSDNNCISEHYQYEIYEGTKVGLMNGKCEIIAKPQYDKMERISNYGGSDSAAFMVQLNNKWGLLSPSGRESIPLIYDTIFPRSKGKSRYAPAMNQGFYFCYKENKAELRNDRNELIVPGEFESFDHYHSNRNAFWMLLNGHELTAFHYGNNTISKIQLADKIDSVYLFVFKDELIPFTLQSNGKGMVLKSIAHLLHQYGNYYFLTLTSPGYQYTSYIFTKSGKHVPAKNLRMIEQVNDSRVLLRHKVGMSLWNTRTGKALTDTIYGEFQTSFAAKNLIWAREFEYKTNTYGPWHPLDTNGKEKTTQTFDNWFFPVKIQSVSVNGKSGIIDTNFNWIVKPAYKSIEVLTKDCFAVQTGGGKRGIINANHTLLADTIYNELTIVYSDCNTYNYYDIPTEVSCLLKKDGEEWLFKSNGSAVRDKELMKKELMNYAFSGNNCSTGFRIHLPAELADEFLKSVFAEFVYDTLSLREDSSEMDPAMNQRYNGNNFTVTAFGKGFCSFSRVSNYDYEMDFGMKRWPEPFSSAPDEYFNLICDGKEIRNFNLADLFSSDQQKDKMIRTAMKRTLSEQQCLSPVLPAIAFYTLSKEGVTIGFNRYQQVLISLEDLEKESTKWILNYLK